MFYFLVVLMPDDDEVGGGGGGGGGGSIVKGVKLKKSLLMSIFGAGKTLKQKKKKSLKFCLFFFLFK